MAKGSSVRNRSQRVSLFTPRGRVEVARQEMSGLARSRGWAWFWVARRGGQQDWHEATTARETIRRATLMAPRQRAPWLDEAAGQVERQLMRTDDGPKGPPPDAS